MGFFTKKLTVSIDNTTEQIDVVQLWEVRWCSFHDYTGTYARNLAEVECFTNYEQALQFKLALENAMKLLRNTYIAQITLQKAKSV